MKMKLLAAVAAVLFPCAAQAAVTVSILQTGADVTITAAGTLDTSGLSLDTRSNYGNVGPSLLPSSGYFSVGGASETARFSGFTGPSTFGPGTKYTAGVLGTGLAFAFNASGFESSSVFLPRNFVSGSAITSSGAFANTTLAALGLTPGTYLYTLAADTIEVQVIAPVAVAAVPEPATWGTMIAGFGLVGATLRRRRVAARTTAALA